ncbi:MAG: LytTR family DNA-binding domain-containing protein [Oscillospiraceae bacterium]|nr:LytTR family DNA-binding domain-containing protein [Oscillospiraceae bacterium]
MKVRFETSDVPELEIVIRGADTDSGQARRLMKLLGSGAQPIVARAQEESVLLAPQEVLYAETVDDRLCACTGDAVLLLSGTLEQLEKAYAAVGYFRCAKSMLVNLMYVERLRSQPNGRILITLRNGEQLLVSRRYAAKLREKIKTGRDTE